MSSAPVARLPPPGWSLEPPVPALVAALKAEGGAARFVGGCVRDTLRGAAVRDIDLATPLAPERVRERVLAAGFKAVNTGISHGTLTVVAARRGFEVTTLRRDVETDGRRARVAFTDDWTVDASRRDFTFNAMSLAPDGALYDPFGGRRDLGEGRVRFVGSARRRIREDYLRILRFFRFLAWFGRPPPDAEAVEACRALAPGIARLSGERVRIETLKLLAAPDPGPALELMAETGALPFVVPAPRAGWRRRLARLVRLERGAADGERRLAALVDGAAAPEAARRLRLSRAQRERLCALAAPAHRVFGLDAAGARRVLRRAGAGRYRDLALLAWAGADTDGGLEEALAAADAWRPVALPVTGRDATALGIPPGPRVGALLRELEAWWEAGDYRAGRAEALERLRELAAEERPPGLTATRPPAAGT